MRYLTVEEILEINATVMGGGSLEDARWLWRRLRPRRQSGSPAGSYCLSKRGLLRHALRLFT